MNKYIITIVSLIVLIAIVHFTTRSAQADEGFYAKGIVGLNSIVPIKSKKEGVVSTIKLKDNFPVMGAGLGYEFANQFRVEGMFDYYFMFKQKEKSQESGSIYNLNLQTKISDVMLNVYKGFALNDNITPFLGGGVGIAHLKDDAKGYVLEPDADGYLLYDKLATTKGKQVYRMAYKLTAGVDLKLGEQVTGELSYNYFHFGKNKPKLVEGVQNITQRKFSVHNISLGARLAL